MKVLYKNILSFFILCFICALFLASIHHHDKYYRNNTCSLCKISSSLSIGVKKATLDGGFVWSAAHALPLFTCLPNYEKIAIILFVTYFSIALHPQSNKAPPLQS
jgi:hypothetical protein